MSQFDHPIGSFEYELREELARINFPGAPLLHDMIVEVVTGVRERVDVEARIAEARVDIEREASMTISNVATRIQGEIDAIKIVASEAIKDLTLGYADVITRLKTQLDDAHNHIERIVSEVVS